MGWIFTPNIENIIGTSNGWFSTTIRSSMVVRSIDNSEIDVLYRFLNSKLLSEDFFPREI